MCFALPTDSTGKTRPSRLPRALLVALGGIILLGILSAGLLFDKLIPNKG